MSNVLDYLEQPATVDQPQTTATNGILNAQLLLSTQPPEVDPIIEGIFDTSDKVSIVGGSKTRKTFFALMLAICTAAGLRFLAWRIPKARTVLFINLEIKAEHFHRRLLLVWKALGCPDVGERLLVLNGRGLGLTVEAIENHVRESKAELVIIDPIYKVLEGDENSVTDWKPTLAAFDRMAKDTGVAVAYVHHDSKGDSGQKATRDRGAGSGILNRDNDAGFTLTEQRDSDQALVVHTILRNYAPHAPVCIEWKDNHFQLSDAPPVVATNGGNTNPTTKRNDSDFFATVAGFVDEEPVNSGDMEEHLRQCKGLTRNKARSVIDSAIDAGLLATFKGGKPCTKWVGKPDDIERRHKLQFAEQSN